MYGWNIADQLRLSRVTWSRLTPDKPVVVKPACGLHVCDRLRHLNLSRTLLSNDRLITRPNNITGVHHARLEATSLAASATAH